MTANQVAAIRAQEDARHNLVTEQETKRHNKKSEAIDIADMEAKYMLEAVQTADSKIEKTTKSIGNIAKAFKDIMSPFSMF